MKEKLKEISKQINIDLNEDDIPDNKTLNSYKVFENKIVDLPMPGSPHKSTSEPLTRPPPRTRFNSPIPVS